MIRSIFGVGVALLVGCTKPNPALKCQTGHCIDPTLPYCDSDGSIAGTPGACIAVDCQPGTLAQCQGDVALMCNATGNDYEQVQCANGCDPAANGCRYCAANETVCTNGVTQTCDANGAVKSSETCPLGCYADQPRCREIDPSNGFGMYLDLVANPPDLTLDDGYFNTETGAVTDGGNPIGVTVPSFSVFAPTGGVPVRVFVANNVTIRNAEAGNASNASIAGPAFALVARGKIVITGTLRATGRAGGASEPGCTGGPGFYTVDGCSPDSSGGGGGANATPGGHGGDVTSYTSGGIGGGPLGTDNLVPLRGGCAGGDSVETGTTAHVGAVGGGAVQLSSREAIEVEGSISVRGEDAVAYDELDPRIGKYVALIYGGGAGGGVLLEAPTVTLGATGKLLAGGGKGAQYCSTPTAACGAGGAGATVSTQAGSGASVSCTTATYPNAAGGGGGGLGRIRINTPGSTFSQTNTTELDGVLTTGELATR